MKFSSLSIIRLGYIVIPTDAVSDSRKIIAFEELMNIESMLVVIEG